MPEIPGSTSASPRLLAIDTATEVVAVAARGPAGSAARSAPGGAEASASLLPAVQAVLAEAGLAATDLDAIAFGAGPGAFTGLRTACAAAQGLAFGLGCPLLPLDDLALWAEDSPWRDEASGPPVWVAVDARMGEVYAAAYRRVAPATWQAEVAPALYTLDALAAAFAAAPPRRLAGNAPAALGDRWPATTAVGHATLHDRPTALLRLAASAWQRGEAIDPALALPLYLRDKVALTTAERAARQAAT
ncbi:MAG: tRNA (adenosine(37)-N6)-threonylcarbamoyltransferase complex dimerization subunit type 1 TsaB [Burkholderiaceae bacterium]|nr:tRNA (adenosine(37)-N6)-threonylcarbamoyltransferase complex dimerization subunit type 1 TsaB [Burkholderiaceae bacterium]